MRGSELVLVLDRADFKSSIEVQDTQALGRRSTFTG